MAVGNEKVAADVLVAVGGKENVTTVAHCMTRLRLNLKDQSIPDDDEVKEIKGVLAAQWVGDQYQVVIGQNVPKVYNELIKLGVAAGGSIDESLGDAPREKLTAKSIGGSILNYLSKSMVQLIPIMMVAAVFRTIAAVCGPTMLNLWAADSDTYNLFYNWLYSAGFYFMPVILGWSAAKVLGASPVLGMMLGGVLIAPEFMTMVDVGMTTTAVYGLPAVVNDYSSTVLPILLCIPVLWQIERFFKKAIPDILSTMFVPFLTMLIVVPISLCALAPIGSVLGTLLGNFLFGLGERGGIVAIITMVIVGGLWEFLVMTGMHQVLIALALANMATGACDSCIMVAAGMASFACYGMALGAALRVKHPDERAENFSFFVSAVVGGVTEPTLYGCGFRHMRTFAGLITGGAAGGLVAGVLGLDVYVVSNASILSFFGYVAGGAQNIVAGVIAMVVAIAVSTLVTFLFGFTKEELDTSAEATRPVA